MQRAEPMETERMSVSLRRDFLMIRGYKTEFMIIQANFSSGFKLAQILVLYLSIYLFIYF